MKIAIQRKLLGSHGLIRWCSTCRRALITLFFLCVAGCATTSNPDPLESINRPIGVFNTLADMAVLEPVARGYRWLLPDFVEQGISNLFVNLGEPFVVVNQVLQGKPGKAASTTGRIVINSTVGVAGWFDVASRWGLQEYDEDFGQTLGTWGLPQGAYLMIPFWGPTTVRDGVGDLVGTFGFLPRYLDDVRAKNIVTALWIIKTRAALLTTETLINGDRYLFVRDAYLQRRAYLTRDGFIEDDFLDD